MKMTSFRSLFVTLLATIFTLTILFHYGKLAIHSERYASYPTNPHLFNQGDLYRAGKILDRDGNILAQTINGKREFNSSETIRRATVHTVGDLEGNVATGVHSVYFNELTGYNFVDGVYDSDNSGNDITLTIDTDMCTTAYKALGGYKGTVGVMNWKTGEILCMVSTPTFDPYYTDQADKDAENGVYVNRLLSGQYAPGSTFKVVTALSGIENFSNLDDKYTCKNGVTIGGEWVSCMGNHGSETMQSGLTHSCNSTFAQIGVKLGGNTLLRTAEGLGFNKKVNLGKITCAKSIVNLTNIRDIDLGWASMGQHDDLINPFHYLTVMSAIANDGVLKEPVLVKKVSTPKGTTLKKEGGSDKRLIAKEDAKTLSDMMRKVVTDYYSDSGFSGLETCGKTGTAEVGEDKRPHSWFVGFCRNESKPYAFVVIVENGGMGAGIAKTIASRVLNS